MSVTDHPADPIPTRAIAGRRAVRHPARLWAGGAGAVVLLGAAVIAANAGTQGRGAVLSQLERPAVKRAAIPAAPSTAASTDAVASATAGPSPVNVSLRAGAYRIELRIGPNRVSAHNAIAVRLTRAGRQVQAAAVSLAYSMPTMGMPTVLTRTLQPTAGGRYGSVDPILAMPGTWRLTFAISAPGTRTFRVVVDDRMHG